MFISGWAFQEDADNGLVKKLGRLKVQLIALGGAGGATYAKRGYLDSNKAKRFVRNSASAMRGQSVIDRFSSRTAADETSPKPLDQFAQADCVAEVRDELSCGVQ